MVALVTGASSGIGRDIAKKLADKNINLILVSRNEDSLSKFAKTLKVKTRIIALDLSKKQNCYKLYEMTKNIKIDILVNNAGFGSCNKFSDSDLLTDINMIDLNVCAVQILSKLYIKDFIRRNRGYILNVASSAGFAAGGPLMATYYATKSYIIKLSLAIYEELRRDRSNVSISVLCPGPVKTKFNERAGVHFSVKPMLSGDVAKMAVEKLFQKQLLIIPGLSMKLSYIASKILPLKWQLRVAYKIQHKKKT